LYQILYQTAINLLLHCISVKMGRRTATNYHNPKGTRFDSSTFGSFDPGLDESQSYGEASIRFKLAMADMTDLYTIPMRST
jgi:hypothetical protein